MQLKVRQNRNEIFKPTFPPKNEQMNSLLLLCDVFLFFFWKKLKSPKKHFEINRPLGPLQFNFCIFTSSQYLNLPVATIKQSSFPKLIFLYFYKIRPFQMFLKSFRFCSSVPFSLYENKVLQLMLNRAILERFSDRTLFSLDFKKILLLT